MQARVSQTSCGAYWIDWETGWHQRSSRCMTVEERNEYIKFGTIPNVQELESQMAITTVSKLLSMCLLVSSGDFAKQPPAKQTEILTGAGGKPIVFVENFASLRNKKMLVERLLKGEDVAMELEFNEIELTKDEKKALEDVRPVLERLRGGPKGDYDWLNWRDQEEAKAYLITRGYQLQSDNVRNPGGYYVTKHQCRKAWDICSKYWTDGVTPGRAMLRSGYEDKVINPQGNSLKLGCQTVSREEVEAIAQMFQFDPYSPSK